MALSFDTSDAARTALTATFNLTAAEANEIALLFIWDSVGPSAVTVGGVAATLIGDITFSGGTQRITAYYFLDPPTSSTAYTATSAGVPELHVLLYKGARQTSQPDSFNSLDDTNPNPFTISTTVVTADSWLVSMARDYVAGAVTAGVGTTLREAGVGASSGDSGGPVGAGSQSMGWVPNSAGNDTAGFIVSIAPAAVAAVSSLTDDFMLLRN